MPVLLLCFLLLMGVPVECRANRVTVAVDSGLSTVDLRGFLYASPAGASYATAGDALAGFRAGGFEHLPGYLGRGYVKGAVWLGFELALGANAPRILVIDAGPAYLDEVRAYQADAHGVITPLGHAGDQVPRGDVALPGLRPAFAMLPDNGTTVLLEIRSTSTKAAIVKLHAGARYPVLQSAEGLLYGAVLAINLVMFMVALVVYRLFHERAYLVWMWYLLLSGTQYMTLGGVLSLYTDWGDRAQLNLFTNVISVLLFAMGALLMTALFQFRQIHPWLHGLHVGWAVMMVLPLMAAPVWGASVVGSAALLGLPIYVVGIVAISVQIVRGHRTSVLHGPMFIIHLVASLVNVLAILGWLEFSEFTFYTWQITSLLNLLSLQAGMFMRVREQMAEATRQRRHYVQALNSKNAELESRVAERTAGLAKALHDVQQAGFEQRQLLSMASHEFRTPAAMIKISIDSLRILAGQITPEVAKRLKNIEHASTRMIDLSNSLIRQDRLRELALHPTRAAVDLRQLVADVVARYASHPSRHDAPLVLADFSCGAPLDAPLTVQADAALLGIALHNLIDNALQHAGPAGGAVPQDAAIRVRMQAHGAHLDLSVADRGPGIPDAEKARIFERFYTLSKTRKAAPEGVAQTYGDGLGLSIVSAIAQAHGGVAYAADNPGGGAVLGLRLPLENPRESRTL